MSEFIFTDISHFIRIVAAGLCGAAIGLERKNRLKEAGVRTHFIVACASCLMMIISKYGFFDLREYLGIHTDPSRVAAQIISGIGFLGVGIIFVQKRTVVGLTTAAGIWATSGIGMSIGSGLYAVGIFSTLVILLAQFVLHRNKGRLRERELRLLTLTPDYDKDSQKHINEILSARKIHVLETKIHSTPDKGRIIFEMIIDTPGNTTEQEILDLFSCEGTIQIYK